MRESWRKLHSALHDRRVDILTTTFYLVQVNNAKDEDEADKLAKAFLSEVERKYPMQTAEEFLREIEETEDWQELTSHMRPYWGKDYRKMMMDAIRFECWKIAGMLVPLFAFADDFPTMFGDTDPALIRQLSAQDRLQPFEFYQAKPFCYREESLFDRKMLISYHGPMRETAWKWFQKKLFNDGILAAQLANIFFHTTLDKEYDPHISPFYLLTPDALGMTSCGSAFEMQPMPQALDEPNAHSYLGKHWKYSYFFSILNQAGWNLYFDGTFNELGTAGYWYIDSEYPENQRREGEVYHNSVRVKEE